MDDDLSCWTRPQITFNIFADRGGRGHMKYSGVVFAGLIAVIVTAAIYLIAPPSAAPPAAPAAVDISADLPDAFTPSEIHAALSQHELSLLPAEQVTVDAPNTADDAAGVDLQASAAPSADPAQLFRNEALLPHENSAGGDTLKPEQARVEETSTESRRVCRSISHRVGDR